jgi:tetratricopeptide (TPR) repeat protein
MKKFLLILSLLQAISCLGQGKIDSLVQVGIQYHDKGEYVNAIKVYNEALKIDPKSTLVNYELALTYMYSGDNEKAIKHSDVVIKQKKGHLLPAYITKGSALDNLGKTTQSIKLFKEAIAEFGDNYLLYYNLGINYSKIQDNKNAELAFVNAITNNPNHVSSHYGLALIEKQLNQRVQSLLSLYYFLLLEPSSKRAETAYKLLREQLGGNVQKDENNPMSINVFLDPKRMDSEFSAAEVMIAMLEASNSLEENKDKTQDELFIDNTKSFFKVLGELKENDSKKSNIWWNFYVPFFYNLAKSEYMDVFCYYISISSNEKAREWLETNSEKFENFGKWISEK